MMKKIIQSNWQEIEQFIRNLRYYAKFKGLLKDLEFEEKLEILSLFDLRDNTEIWAEIGEIFRLEDGTGWANHYGVWKITIKKLERLKEILEIDGTIVFRPLGKKEWYNEDGEKLYLTKIQKQRLNILHPSRYETWNDGAIRSSGRYEYELPADLIKEVKF